MQEKKMRGDDGKKVMDDAYGPLSLDEGYLHDVVYEEPTAHYHCPYHRSPNYYRIFEREREADGLYNQPPTKLPDWLLAVRLSFLRDSLPDHLYAPSRSIYSTPSASTLPIDSKRWDDLDPRWLPWSGCPWLHSDRPQPQCPTCLPSWVEVPSTSCCGLGAFRFFSSSLTLRTLWWRTGLPSRFLTKTKKLVHEASGVTFSFGLTTPSSSYVSPTVPRGIKRREYQEIDNLDCQGLHYDDDIYDGLMQILSKKRKPSSSKHFRLSTLGHLRIDYSSNWSKLDRFIGHR
ncbi:hypothetical protein AAG570_009901 [Ranatra chinensis]|uniref:Uncharacterized protein n=1 Tax=Ranatra chinensis TaxID=642074 RepID=A0ABD0YQE8_9HEMI